MDHIERVVVDEGVGRDSELMAQFRDRLGDRQVVLYFWQASILGFRTLRFSTNCWTGGRSCPHRIGCCTTSLSAEASSQR